MKFRSFDVMGKMLNSTGILEGSRDSGVQERAGDEPRDVDWCFAEVGSI